VLSIAYLANQFPSPVEPYVGEEIEELRRRGVSVVAGSVRRPAANRQEGNQKGNNGLRPEIVLQELGPVVLLRALWLCTRRWHQISDLMVRVVCRGSEGPTQRVKALLHTWLGACYAIRLQKYGVQHIHVHHGYFGSWIAMVAARLLEAGFSMTLHGSDLLLGRRNYLDVKLKNCKFCLTISEFNRQHILRRYPEVSTAKVIVSRLGVEVDNRAGLPATYREAIRSRFSLLAVGRLHAVKDHAFLIRACAELRNRGLDFECSITGEGPERNRLESLIRRYGLEERVTLPGHTARDRMNSLYDRADVVVLTSRSEGIPLVLMEAMARGRIVLAPDITGIPELVIAGNTGFLYEPGSLGDFVRRLLMIHSFMQVRDVSDSSRSPSDTPARHFASAAQLDWIRHAARVQVRLNFNRSKNLKTFAELFRQRITPHESIHYEDSLLQQIQLPVQWNRGVPVRTDGADESAGTRSGVVLDV
jgi:colanic acid/amylovoran biosynthesis glycosyltransferase